MLFFNLRPDGLPALAAFAAKGRGGRMTSWILEIKCIFLRIIDNPYLIVFNAVFSAYEMALASISRTKLTYLVQTKKMGPRKPCS